MNLHLRIASLIAITIYFMLIFFFLKKGRLNLKYTLLWIFSGIAMFLVIIWPGFFESLTKLIGIQEFTNGIFGMVSFFILIILMSLTAIVSKLNEKNKNFNSASRSLRKKGKEY